jgi:hypothetical protein
VACVVTLVLGLEEPSAAPDPSAAGVDGRRCPGRICRLSVLISALATARREHSARVYTATLRRKLEKDPSHPRYLLTASGSGYRFQAKPGAQPGPAR